MDLITFLSFFISPVILIIALIFFYYKFNFSNWSKIKNAVLFGTVGIAFLLIANYVTDLIWHDNLNNLRRMAFFVFVIVAFSAELGKFLPLRLKFYNQKDFKGPFESIRYSVLISLSFSMIAVILFAFDIVGTEKIKTPLLFLYTYPFANIFFGIVMGFFLGLGKIRKNFIIDEAVALFITAFFHGTYYFCFISSDIRLFVVTTFGFIVIGITLLAKAMSLRSETV